MRVQSPPWLTRRATVSWALIWRVIGGTTPATSSGWTRQCSPRAIASMSKAKINKARAWSSLT